MRTVEEIMQGGMPMTVGRLMQQCQRPSSEIIEDVYRSPHLEFLSTYKEQEDGTWALMAQEEWVVECRSA